MLLLLSALALAAPEIALGLEHGITPKVEPPGLRLAAGLGLTDVVAVGVLGALHPDLRRDAYRTTVRLLRDYARDELETRVEVRAEAWVRFAPVRVERGGWRTDVGVQVGLGVVQTDDDDEYIESDTAVEVEQQLHVAPTVGIVGTAARGGTGLRLHLARSTWSEDIADEVVGRGTTWLVAEVVLGKR